MVPGGKVSSGGHTCFYFCCVLQGLLSGIVGARGQLNFHTKNGPEKNPKPDLIDTEAADEAIFHMSHASKNRQEIITSSSSAFVMSSLFCGTCCCFPCFLSPDEVDSSMILLVTLWKHSGSPSS